MFKIGKFVEQLFFLAGLYVASYQFMVFFLGGHGLLVHRRLLQAQERLESHYIQLEKYQHELLTLSDQIQSDQNYMAIEARGLGYYQKNDKLILVNTWSQAQPAPSPGDQLILEAQVMQPKAVPGIWFYALFPAGLLALLIRLLQWDRPIRFGRKLNGFREPGYGERFPKVHHIHYGRPARHSTLKELRRNRNNHGGSGIA